MENLEDTWSIAYIPGVPAVSPTRQPTVRVVVSAVEPKAANALIRRLNQISPLENLRHVKRIRKIRLEEGVTQLSVILCLAPENGDSLGCFTPALQHLVDSNDLLPSFGEVCKFAATSKEEWEEQCKLWPTSYHPPTYNIEGIKGFEESSAKLIHKYMTMAIKLAKSGDISVINAAVIVDPSSGQIVAHGCDETNLCLGVSTSKTKSPSQFKGASRHSLTNGVDERESTCEILINASCMNPLHWSCQQPNANSPCSWHPLRHAAVVAIESSAEKNRQQFPDPVPVANTHEVFSSDQRNILLSSPKRQKTCLVDEAALQERPYLCTNYDAFLVWEPCAMCAMALIHQRIRRLFYAFPNPTNGALGSVHRLQGEKSLNHHYAVFRITVPEEVIYVV